ncbi:hypothetical protein BB560_003100, partial [Smittium megazygosporum]
SAAIPPPPPPPPPPPSKESPTPQQPKQSQPSKSISSSKSKFSLSTSPASFNYQKSSQSQNVQINPNSGHKKYATVLYNFAANGPDEISVKQSQVVELVSDLEGGWSNVIVDFDSSRPATGIVPTSFLKAQDQSQNKSSVPDPKSKQENGTLLTAAEMLKIQHKKDNTHNHNRSGQHTVNSHKPATSGSSAKKENDFKIEGIRKWTDANGNFSIDARFLYLDDNNVVYLIKQDGNEINAPLSKLSAKDQAYIKQDIYSQSHPQSKNTYKKPWRQRKPSNFDWFDFFTLKANINADKALRYDTSFTDEGLDGQSISELLDEKDNDTIKYLGVNAEDIPAIISAFQKHLGIKTSQKTQNKADTQVSSAPEPKNANKPAPADDAWIPKNKLKPVIVSKASGQSSTQAATTSTTIKTTFSKPGAPTDAKKPVSSKPPIPSSKPQPISKPVGSSLDSNQAKLVEQEQKLKNQEEELKKTRLLLQQQNDQLMQIKQTRQVEEQLAVLKSQKEKQEVENQWKDLLSQKALISQQQKQLEDMKKAIEENKTLFKQHQTNIRQASPITNTSTSASQPQTTGKLMEPLAPTRLQQTYKPNYSGAVSNTRPGSTTTQGSFTSIGPSTGLHQSKYSVFENTNPTSSSVFTKNPPVSRTSTFTGDSGINFNSTSAAQQLGQSVATTSVPGVLSNVQAPNTAAQINTFSGNPSYSQQQISSIGRPTGISNTPNTSSISNIHGNISSNTANVGNVNRVNVQPAVAQPSQQYSFQNQVPQQVGQFSSHVSGFVNSQNPTSSPPVQVNNQSPSYSVTNIQQYGSNIARPPLQNTSTFSDISRIQRQIYSTTSTTFKLSTANRCTPFTHIVLCGFFSATYITATNLSASTNPASLSATTTKSATRISDSLFPTTY